MNITFDIFHYAYHLQNSCTVIFCDFNQAIHGYLFLFHRIFACVNPRWLTKRLPPLAASFNNPFPFILQYINFNNFTKICKNSMHVCLFINENV